jgi:integrase/recombinase XerD
MLTIKTNALQTDKKTEHTMRAASSHLDSDVWSAAELGFSRGERLFFDRIHQLWLKDACKRFTSYSAATKSWQSLRQYLYTIISFSRFLHTYAPGSQSDIIQRETMLAYLASMNTGTLSGTTRNQRMVLLRCFFQVANLNEWLVTDPYLIRDEDIPAQNNPAPRFIPPEVLEQLNSQLHRLPQPVARMVMILQECGLRASELLLLRRTCIEQDSRGEWYCPFQLVTFV